MRIGIDIMGGDYAPDVTVLGSKLALEELPKNAELVLIGQETAARSAKGSDVLDHPQVSIVDVPEVIDMGEHPLKAFNQKQKSSIVEGFSLLAEGKIDAFASAGNTGAMLVGAMQVIKSIPGVIRPGIAAAIPNINKTPTLLLDVGINPDCRPDVLYQYGFLGSLYMKDMYGVNNPRVALLNIGEEEEKGSLLTKAAYQAMKESKDFNFVGNFEGNDFFVTNKADVVVCEGFVGNVVLKEAEAFYTLIKKMSIGSSSIEEFNFEHTGGTPILGIKKPVIIGHGISSEYAIKNMIIHTNNVAEAGLVEKFSKAFD